MLEMIFLAALMFILAFAFVAHWAIALIAPWLAAWAILRLFTLRRPSIPSGRDDDEQDARAKTAEIFDAVHADALRAEGYGVDKPRFTTSRGGRLGGLELFEGASLGCDVVAYIPPAFDLRADGATVMYIDLAQGEGMCGVEGLWEADVKRVQVLHGREAVEQVGDLPFFAPTLTNASRRPDLDALQLAIVGA